jgi:hypothetical protein
MKMLHIRGIPEPFFKGGKVMQSLRGDPVKSVNGSIDCLSPKVLVNLSIKEHAPNHFHDRAIVSLSNNVLFGSIGHREFLADSFLSKIVLNLSVNIFFAIITPKPDDATSNVVEKQKIKMLNMSENFILMFHQKNETIAGMIIFKCHKMC